MCPSGSHRCRLYYHTEPYFFKYSQGIDYSSLRCNTLFTFFDFVPFLLPPRYNIVQYLHPRDVIAVQPYRMARWTTAVRFLELSPPKVSRPFLFLAFYIQKLILPKERGLLFPFLEKVFMPPYSRLYQSRPSKPETHELILEPARGFFNSLFFILINIFLTAPSTKPIFSFKRCISNTPPFLT